MLHFEKNVVLVSLGLAYSLNPRTDAGQDASVKNGSNCRNVDSHYAEEWQCGERASWIRKAAVKATSCLVGSSAASSLPCKPKSYFQHMLSYCILPSPVLLVECNDFPMAV
jgi:hypothetical protein